jgi:hypothetical protein
VQEEFLLGALVARRRFILNSQNDNGYDSFLLSKPANEGAKNGRVRQGVRRAATSTAA